MQPDKLEHKSEDGILNLPARLRVAIIFETVPVWILRLNKEYLWEISFPHVKSFTKLRAIILNNQGPVAAIVNYLGRSLFKFGKDTPPADICLISGNITFLFKMFNLVQCKALFITDLYYNPRRIPQGPIKLKRLSHKSVGGCTTFMVLYGKNFMPGQEFTFTSLRQTLKDFMDYSVPPIASLLSPTIFLNSDNLMPHSCTDLVIKYSTRFSKSGIGFRKLQEKELMNIYGLPHQLLPSVLATSVRNLVPVDIMQALLRCAMRNFPSQVPMLKTNLKLPREQNPTKTIFLQYIKRILPPLWCANAIKTTASTKNDDAETNINLWNLRILPLFPSSTLSTLSTLRVFLKQIYNKQLFSSYRTYLWN